MKLAQANLNDIFGTVKPPAGVPGGSGDPFVALGHIMAAGINIALIVAGVTALIYLLWGSLNWVTSSGDKENIEKARGKLLHATWGIIIFIIMLVLWTVITGCVLGIVNISNGISFSIPTFDSPGIAVGGGCGGQSDSPRRFPNNPKITPQPVREINATSTPRPNRSSQNTPPTIFRQVTQDPSITVGLPGTGGGGTAGSPTP